MRVDPFSAGYDTLRAAAEAFIEKRPALRRIAERARDEGPSGGRGPDAHPARWEPAKVARRTRTAEEPARVGVIGSGLSGLHFAWLLRRRGYRQVVVLETEEQVKEAVAFEMRVGARASGSFPVAPPRPRRYASPLLRSLLRRYDLEGALGEARGPFQRVEDHGAPRTSFREWALSAARRDGGASGALPDWALAKWLRLGLRRHSQLHRRLLGAYDGALPPRPSAATLRTLSEPYRLFLKKNGLDGLRPLLGAPLVRDPAEESVPAMVGLMANDPTSLEAMAGRLDPEQLERPLTRSLLQRLLAGMAAEEKIARRRGVRIEEIRKLEVGFEVLLREGKQAPERMIFDRIALSTEAQEQPCWSGEEIRSGAPWALLARQGEGGIFKIGACARTNDPNAMVEYNLLLMHLYFGG